MMSLLSSSRYLFVKFYIAKNKLAAFQIEVMIGAATFLKDAYTSLGNKNAFTRKSSSRLKYNEPENPIPMSDIGVSAFLTVDLAKISFNFEFFEDTPR